MSRTLVSVALPSCLLPEEHGLDFSTGQCGGEGAPGHGDEPSMIGTAGARPVCVQSPGMAAEVLLWEEVYLRIWGLSFPEEAVGGEGEPASQPEPILTMLTGRSTCPLQASVFLSGKWALKPLAHSIT